MDETGAMDGAMGEAAARASLHRWLRRQLAQPTPVRERLEAAVEGDDPAEVRRLLPRLPFSPEQRAYVDLLLARWEDAAAARRAADR